MKKYVMPKMTTVVISATRMMATSNPNQINNLKYTGDQLGRRSVGGEEEDFSHGNVGVEW